MASPSILPTPYLSSYSGDLFANYKSIFVDYFDNLVNFLRNPNFRQFFFSPSSEYIITNSSRYKEYVRAKTLLEEYASSCNQFYGDQLNIFTPRLPIMATKQTTGALHKNLPDPIEILCQEILPQLVSFLE